MFICIDLDGTIFENKFPKIGKVCETNGVSSVSVIKELEAAGHVLILWTVRSTEYLDMAKMALINAGVLGCFTYINNNPTQLAFSSSRKVYADVYIDDLALGSFLSKDDTGTDYINWELVRKQLVEREFLIS